jgi:hypothetical protein
VFFGLEEEQNEHSCPPTFAERFQVVKVIFGISPRPTLFRRIQTDPPSGISACPKDDNIMLWKAVIFGPDDTIWEAGTFTLTMEFTEVFFCNA